MFGRHVLVVWLGNFDGSSNPALIGVDAAAPLFMRMVDALRAERLDPGEMATKQSPNLRQVEVCAATGGLPDALCPIRTTAWFIAGKSPITASSLHRAMWVDERSGKVVCGPSSHGHAKRQVVEQWGSDMQSLFAQAGLPRNSVAEPECSGTATNGAMISRGNSDARAAAPAITSPLRGVTHSIRTSHPTPISLRAEAAAGVRQLYWFADDVLIGKAGPGESLVWQPSSPRAYLLRVVDDAGRVESREVVVEWVP